MTLLQHFIQRPSIVGKAIGYGEEEVKSKTLPQHVASLSASMGALAAGAVLGWSSPVGLKIKQNEAYSFTISPREQDWVSSLVPLGAACSCIPTGLVMDAIGRKKTMLLLALPFVIGWILITGAENVYMLLLGRFICGFSGGAFCVTAPSYNNEIVIDAIRGSVGTYFQLMITIGILFAYAVGSFTSLVLFNIICLTLPIFFFAIFFFMPESPKYLIGKGKDDAARKSLIRLRGEKYNVDKELSSLKKKQEEAMNTKSSVLTQLKKKPAFKAVAICYALMVFQQLSGINAVIFNTSTIFETSGAHLAPAISSTIIGIIQVFATLFSMKVVDKLGRTILLLLSSSIMAACTAVLGIFFYLKDSHQNVDSISWLPLLSLSLFIIAFSIGMGPIPWMMAGEFCQMEIKSFVSSSGGTLNWALAFLVTCTFGPLNEVIGSGPVFWIFAAIEMIGFLFVLFVVPETKGKSIDEVQKLLLEKKKIKC